MPSPLTRSVGPLIAFALIAPALLLLMLGAGTMTPTTCPTTDTQDVDGEGLTAAQLAVATQVVETVRAFVPTQDLPHAAVVALATARQESGILDLPYGDRDSLGVFQQRPSQGWGTPAQIMNITYATTVFLQHLVAVPHWQALPVTVAAADVQNPAPEYRDRYAQWVPLATALTNQLWPIALDSTTTSTTSPTSPTRGGDAVGFSSWPASLAPGPPGGSLVTGDLPDVGCGADVHGVVEDVGVVVYPVPANLADTNQDNWGGHGSRWGSWHTGTDFAVPCGTPVLAATAGTIEIQTGPGWYGNWLVKVVTGPTSLSTWYAHMREVDVVNGQSVGAGEQIGEAGDLGNATGCHLHFEVHLHNGSIYGPDNVDPTPWLAENVGQSLTGSPSHPAMPGSFTLASFNALGDSHTRPGGNKPGWADGATRTHGLAQLLETQAPDIVGLQEFEPPQQQVLASIASQTWTGYGNKDNVIIWRRAVFGLVAAHTIPVPYFGGAIREMPVVRLQNFATGQIITVISVHNPADARGPAAQWRAEAIARERTEVQHELANGRAVYLIGDFNDRAPAFCSVTASHVLISASGGSHTGTCNPPPDMQIDWIFGAGTSFTDYLVDHSPQGRISDHPYVEAAALPDGAGLAGSSLVN